MGTYSGRDIQNSMNKKGYNEADKSAGTISPSSTPGNISSVNPPKKSGGSSTPTNSPTTEIIALTNEAGETTLYAQDAAGKVSKTSASQLTQQANQKIQADIAAAEQARNAAEVQRMINAGEVTEMIHLKSNTGTASAYLTNARGEPVVELQEKEALNAINSINEQRKQNELGVSGIPNGILRDDVPNVFSSLEGNQEGVQFLQEKDVLKEMNAGWTNNIPWVQSTSDFLADVSGPAVVFTTPLRFIPGIAEGAWAIIRHPIESTTGFAKDVWGIATQNPETQEKFAQVGERFETDPGYIFEFAGQFYGAKKGVEAWGSVLPRVSYEEVKVPTNFKEAQGDKFIEIKMNGQDVLVPRPEVPTEYVQKSIGIETPKILEFIGVKKTILEASQVQTEIAIRDGELIRIKRTSGGEFKETGPNVPETEIVIGNKITGRIEPSEISTAQGFPAPVEGAAFKAFTNSLIIAEVTKAQMLDVTRIGELVFQEKGFPVNKFQLNIKGVKNPIETTQIVESLVKEGEGIYYGSLLTEQLPKSGGFKLPLEEETISILKKDKVWFEKNKHLFEDTELKLSEGFQTKQGDVDTQFPNLAVEEINPLLKRAVPKLQKAGELIEESPGGKNILQFKKENLENPEGKFFEAKSGINQESLGLEDEAPAGIAGFKFANLKEGRAPGSVVKFGENKAITAGEQTLRKLAGASITSPGKLPGETPSFSEPGILGRQGNPRGLKDVATSLLQMKGIAKIKQARWNPLEKARGRELEELANKRFLSYSPEQQADIIKKLSDVLNNPEELASIKASFMSPEKSPSFSEKTSALPIAKQESAEKKSSPKETRSPSIKLSEKDFMKVSPVKSPAAKSPSPRPSFQGASSFGSPSAKGSPGSKSPRTSPRSPSVTIESPSGFPSPSPRTKSPSPRSPSPRSPSPTPKSPSPFPGSPSPTSNNPPSKLFAGLPIFLTEKGNQKVFGYDVLMIEHKKVVKANERPLPREEAIRLGKDIAENSLSASFKIVRLQNKVPAARRSKLATGGNVSNLNFNPSKSREGFFVEKNQFRLNTLGEKEGITAARLIAERKKNVLGGLRA